MRPRWRQNPTWTLAPWHLGSRDPSSRCQARTHSPTTTSRMKSPSAATPTPPAASALAVAAASSSSPASAGRAARSPAVSSRTQTARTTTSQSTFPSRPSVPSITAARLLIARQRDRRVWAASRGRGSGVVGSRRLWRGRPRAMGIRRRWRYCGRALRGVVTD